MPFQLKTHAQQVADHLRIEIQQGRWEQYMPGSRKIEQELGVSHTIVDEALRLLELEGIVENRGPGCRRRILPSPCAPSSFRIRLLLYESGDREHSHLNKIIHKLQELGYDARFASRTMADLKMNVHRIASFVKANGAEAWIVLAGSKEILEWFSKQSTPTFALFGRIMDVRMAAAAPNKMYAISELIDQLVEKGHRRIVNIAREERRKPTAGFTESFFLQELEKHNISTGLYNLPDWGDTPAELQSLLDTLFHHTPPTALLVDEPSIYIAVRDYLTRNGICIQQQYK